MPEAGEQTRDEQAERLDSWKAIARHLGRDVRSVQRWERDRGLPIHRVPGARGGAVFAFRGELDHWLRSGSAAAEPPASPAPAARAAEVPKTRVPVQAFLWSGAAALVVILAALLIVRWRGREPSPAPGPIIAVLPLRNLSGDPREDYFVDGFTEELATELTHLGPPLRVISVQSTARYKGSGQSVREIARRLGAQLVVQGAVLREGQRVRVTSQLVDAASGAYLMARTDEGQVKDLLDFQRRIARNIAEQVRLRLSPTEQARLASVTEVDPEALDLYLQARYQYAKQTRESVRQSLALYQAAAARAPSFARAYVGIAEAHLALLQITAETPDTAAAQARLALERAIAIDPHSGEALGLLAYLDYWRDWDWPRAEREFRLALSEGERASTEQRFGAALLTRRRFAEGMAHLESAVELDPFGLSPRINLIEGLLDQKDFAGARRELVPLLERNPNFIGGHVLMAATAALQRDCAEADRQAHWLQVHYPSPMAQIVSVFGDACRGDLAAGRRTLDAAAAAASHGKMFASPFQFAIGYAAIGDRDTALAYLAKSANLREPLILAMGIELTFEPFRSDPRFIALEKRVHLIGGSEAGR